MGRLLDCVEHRGKPSNRTDVWLVRGPMSGAKRKAAPKFKVGWVVSLRPPYLENAFYKVTRREWSGSMWRYALHGSGIASTWRESELRRLTKRERGDA